MRLKDLKKLQESIDKIVNGYGKQDMDEMIKGCWSIIKSDWEYKTMKQQIRRSLAWGRADELMTVQDIFNTLKKYNPGFDYDRFKTKVELLIAETLQDEGYNKRLVNGQWWYLAAVSKNVLWNQNETVTADEFANM